MFKVSLDESFIMKVAEASGALTQSHLNAANEMMANLAQETYAKAQEMAGMRLSSTRQKYIDNLSFQQVSPGHWTVVLKGDAAHLEEGYGAYSMIKAGLARGKASKVSKAGYRYVKIPFEHSEKAARSSHPENARPVQIGQAQETTRGSLAQDLKAIKRIFGDKGITKTESGSPVLGKVYSITRDTMTNRWTQKDSLGQQVSQIVERPISSLLEGITKIQYQVPSKSGMTTRSMYMTWRTASENPNAKGKWIHSGFSGARIYPDLQNWVIDQMTRRLTEIFNMGG